MARCRLRCLRVRTSFLSLVLIFIICACLYILHHRSEPVVGWDKLVKEQSLAPYTQQDVIDNRGKRLQFKDVGPTYRFVMGLNFWEQFNKAVSNFFHLVFLASMWHSQTVVPFTYNSRLYGLRHYKPDDNMEQKEPALDLSVIYDPFSLEAAVANLGLPPLVSFNDFLALAKRELVVVHFISDKPAHEIPVLEGDTRTYLLEGFSHSNVVDCHSHLAAFASMLLQNLNYEAVSRRVSPFTIHRYFCVNMSHLTTPRELASKIGIDSGDSNSSLVIFNWRGSSDNPVIKSSATGSHLNKRIMISEVEPRNPGLIAHSDQVITATKHFLQYLNLTGDYLAIHLRSEKIGFREPRFKGSTRACMDKVLRIRDQILTPTPSLQTIVITDYGPYSSDTCKHCKGGEAMKELLSEVGIVPVHYDPLLLGTVVDRGFAAAVEMRVLASARFLIVCGGGAYQSRMIQRFLNGQPNAKQRLFTICVDDNDVKKLVNQ